MFLEAFNLRKTDTSSNDLHEFFLIYYLRTPSLQAH